MHMFTLYRTSVIRLAPPPLPRSTHTPSPTHTHARTHARTHTHTHIHPYARTYTRTYTHTHTHTHTHTQAYTLTHKHARTHTHTHTHTHTSVCWQKLFKRSPGDRVNQKTLKQLVRRCTIFTVLTVEESGVSVLPSTLSTMPSQTVIPSTDVSDVEYLFHWQAPSEPQPHATRHAEGI